MLCTAFRRIRHPLRESLTPLIGHPTDDLAISSFSEDDTPLDFFGQQLKVAGYNYLGHEPMYSGVTGEEFAADIYLGVVYYQRLRHMVNDKFQVRTTGPIDQRTHQPVKGRKRAGGIRFGEMERDALVAHGTSYLLQDRLVNCSDYSTAWVCRTCGSLISLGYDITTMSGVQTIAIETDQSEDLGPNGEYCRICRAEDDRRRRADEPARSTSASAGGGTGFKVPQNMVLRRGGALDVIAVPYVLKYLVAELAAMSMRISFQIVP